MIYHVLPGDSLVEQFKKTGIKGEVIVCREAFIVGPADADDLVDLWDQRGRFILAEFGEDEIEYHEKVADELDRLTEIGPGDEVFLWFEYELFCSVNLWFCLSVISGVDAEVYRVEPIGIDESDRWNGFGNFTADDLKACFELRTKMSEEDVALGAGLWNAYRHGDHESLIELGKVDSPSFPHLHEVVAAAAEQEIQPIETIKAIIAGGETDFEKIFVEFKKRDGVYGFGDLQVQKLLDQLSS